MQEKRILGNESLVLLGVGATGVSSFFFLLSFYSDFDLKEISIFCFVFFKFNFA